jgi:hypothetical protein
MIRTEKTERVAGWVLRPVLDANDLRQKDLAPIFGSESIVSELSTTSATSTNPHREIEQTI